ncbi:MAG: oxidoreductase [Burkholderiaceae bacterium]|nr:MAG: oxidoreductase [Burkholderiaceae bacterium]
MNPLSIDASLFAGLQALAESAFPKRCASCGRVFETAQQFMQETEAIRRGQTGLKQSLDDDNRTVIEVFRNCPCGSTLMDFFSDRRDLSDGGLKRREKFGLLLEQLIARGLDPGIARSELLKVLRGEGSAVLNQYLKPT